MPMSSPQMTRMFGFESGMVWSFAWETGGYATARTAARHDVGSAVRHVRVPVLLPRPDHRCALTTLLRWLPESAASERLSEKFKENRRETDIALKCDELARFPLPGAPMAHSVRGKVVAMSDESLDEAWRLDI